jgi:hypothetical protein
MTIIEVKDPRGKIVTTLHNREERRGYAKSRGVTLRQVRSGAAPQAAARAVKRPLRHVTSRTPAGGSGPSEKAAERALFYEDSLHDHAEELL